MVSNALEKSLRETKKDKQVILGRSLIGVRKTMPINLPKIGEDKKKKCKEGKCTNEDEECPEASEKLKPIKMKKVKPAKKKNKKTESKACVLL
ncbi:Oidioi.mRNA.OKI2018_I69.chr1.g2681.t1.cds [Oikopleura dioica]|uniref:Oidioi.mRNA.OKI2018_I69.chr1.g2681.t1.cds n=1 Tax=Oikopleura dioica TaxID=34765 RepID=A0ABN7STK5_OIKDI|nr:Oidioi.mRNA.OKI2018_I69.chr1.g2681.t1.cds [Oikopleura dioica]